MKKLMSGILAVSAAFIITSCGSTKVEKYTTDWIESSVNETEKCGYFMTTEELGQFSMIEGEFKKDSGYEGSGFGFAMGYSSQKNGILKDYIRFEINTEGEYALYSYNGTFTDLVDSEASGTAFLVESGKINTGLGSVNKLKVETTDSGKYNFSINGSRVASNVEPLENATGGVMVFYSIGKADQEQFPDTPVKFSYRITDSKFVEKK